MLFLSPALPHAEKSSYKKMKGKVKITKISEDDKKYLKDIAQKTWQFFKDCTKDNQKTKRKHYD
jgi:hypothetical protein